VRKKFAIAGGFVTVVAAVTILPLIFDPSVFRRYREMLGTAAIEAKFIPTVSGVLRLIFFRPYFTAQFVPMMLALVWSVWSCIKNMSNWSWRDHGLTVMVISTLTTSYGWLTDANGSLASGAVCRDVYLRQQKEISRETRITLVVFAFLNWMMPLLIASHITLQSGIYFWSSLLWCAWYFYRRHRLSASLIYGFDPAV